MTKEEFIEILKTVREFNIDPKLDSDLYIRLVVQGSDENYYYRYHCPITAVGEIILGSVISNGAGDWKKVAERLGLDDVLTHEIFAAADERINSDYFSLSLRQEILDALGLTW